MHIVFRIGFWLSLAGLGIALLAPVMTSAVSYAEAQPDTYIALIAVFGFGIGSILSTSRRPNEDGFDHATRRRRGAIVYSLLAFLVMTGIGGIGEASAQGSWRSDSTSSADSMSSASSSYSSHYDSWREDDSALGTWTYLYAMLAGGVCFFSMVGFAATKPKRAYAQSQQGHWAYPGYVNPAFAATQYPAQQYPYQPHPDQQAYAQPPSYPPGAPLPSFAQNVGQEPYPAQAYYPHGYDARGYYPSQQ